MSVVIVAGASKGIGLEISKYLRQSGLEVIGVSRSFDPNVRNVFNEVIELDVTTEDGIRCLEDSLRLLEYKVVGLVNNIGQSAWRAIENIDINFVSELFKVNVISQIMITKVVIANHPIESIVNIGSIAGRRGSANNTAYSASKFAINGVTQSLAKELGQRNIRVNTVSPVLIKTPGLEEALNSQDSPSSGSDITKFMKDFAMAQSALNRLPTAAEVAKVVKFLLSDDSSAITGQNINVDCGVFPQ
jgi:NAD(P)-dependent dehydrogenase (short-subunit alcohol dehydrogenase family)